jgi:hypothetical protein
VPGTAVGLIFIDFIVRPFAKIFEKMPLLMLVLLVGLYAVIAYVVLKSAYQSDDGRSSY